MKRIISLADFDSVWRQLPSDPDRLALVARIEQAYRKALGVESATDDAIIAATLDPSGQTEAERAGWRVVRMCIAVREAGDGNRGRRLDQLTLALGDADPDRVLGADTRKRNKAGGAKTAEARKREAEKADRALEGEARKRLKQNSRLTVSDLARYLAERELGTFETLRKKPLLRKLVKR